MRNLNILLICFVFSLKVQAHLMPRYIPVCGTYLSIPKVGNGCKYSAQFKEGELGCYLRPSGKMENPTESIVDKVFIRNSPIENSHQGNLFKDESNKESRKKRSFARKVIAILKEAGIPNVVNGYELFGMISLGLFFLGLLVMILWSSVLGLVFVGLGMLASILTYFSLRQDNTLKGKGFSYGAIILGLLLSFSIVLYFLWLIILVLAVIIAFF
jgi:hypothetical protein